MMRFLTKFILFVKTLDTQCVQVYYDGTDVHIERGKRYG